DLHIGGIWRRGNQVLVDSGRDFGFFEDVTKVCGEAVTDVDHGVSLWSDGTADPVTWYRKQMTLDRRMLGIAGAKLFETESGPAERSCQVNAVAWLRI